MDNAKSRAMIKSQAAKKKETDDVDPRGMGSSNPTIKRNSRPKGTVLPRSLRSFWSPL